MVSGEDEQGVWEVRGLVAQGNSVYPLRSTRVAACLRPSYLTWQCQKIGQAHGSPSDLIIDGEFHGKLVSSKALFVEKWMIRTGGGRRALWLEICWPGFVRTAPTLYLHRAAPEPPQLL